MFRAGSGLVGLSVVLLAKVSLSTVCALGDGLRWRLRWWGGSLGLDFGRGGGTIAEDVTVLV